MSLEHIEERVHYINNGMQGFFLFTNFTTTKPRMINSLSLSALKDLYLKSKKRGR